MKFLILFLIANIVNCYSLFSQSDYPQHPDSSIFNTVSYDMEYMNLNVALLNFLIIDTTFLQKPVYKLKVKAQSTKKADLLFQVDNEYVTIFDQSTFLPLKVTKNIHQKNIQHQLSIHFDHTHNLAWISEDEKWEILDPCFDYFSMLYFLSSSKCQHGDTLRFYLDSESLISRVEAVVSPNPESIKIPSGEFSCQKIQLKFNKLNNRQRAWKTDLLTNRLAKPGSRLTIWFTDDVPGLPVKITYHQSILNTTLILKEFKIQGKLY